MSREPQYISQNQRYLSNAKEYRQKSKHAHKLSDSILQTSFLGTKRTDRDCYNSVGQYKNTKGDYQRIRKVRPSMYERGEGENRVGYGNYISNYEEERTIKSPRNYDLESSRLTNYKRNEDPYSYLSVSMVQGQNSTINKNLKPGTGGDIKMYRSPRRELGKNTDDILKRIKDQLSPKPKEQESFYNQNSTANSKYSVGSTMQSYKIKTSQYYSPNFLAKMKAQGTLTKECGFTKKKQLFSPKNNQKNEEKSSIIQIPQGLGGTKIINKFIYQPNLSSFSHIHQKQETISLKDFYILKMIGEGNFGLVYKAIHKLTGAIFALKKIPKHLIKSKSEEKQFLLQIKYQMFFNHPNIVKLYGIFNDKDNLYLILEYMQEGTLFQNLQKRSELMTQKEVSCKIKQTFAAISYLQDLDVLHRDIKPQNIVLSHGVGKLCDFGWATKCEDRRNTFCGTYAYAAPEILEGKQYDRSVDIWCLGMLTYELLTGIIAFNQNQKPQLNSKRSTKTQNLLDNDHPPQLFFPKCVSKTARNFVEIILRKDPKSRASIFELSHHAFLSLASE